MMLAKIFARKADVCWKFLATTVRMLRRKSDYDRWRGIESFLADWDSRTCELAALIQPGSSVIEFGAGLRALETLLPSGCTYTPSDFIHRGPGTFLCDLNSPQLPDLPWHTVAVFGGVLEYVYDVRRVVTHVGQRVQCIVASYAVAQPGAKRLIQRRPAGWVNDFTEDELVRLFQDAGFRPDHRRVWKAQLLFRFVKDGQGSTC